MRVSRGCLDQEFQKSQMKEVIIILCQKIMKLYTSLKTGQISTVMMLTFSHISTFKNFMKYNGNRMNFPYEMTQIILFYSNISVQKPFAEIGRTSVTLTFDVIAWILSMLVKWFA